MSAAVLTFPAFVDDAGAFALADRRGFRDQIARVQRFRGQDVVVVVKMPSRRQGTRAMRYYRGVVIPDIARAMGYADPADYESVHDALAWKFLRIEDGPFGAPRRRSTAKGDLSAEEFSDYLSQVIQFAEAEIVGCRVRRPNEVDDELMPGGEDVQ